MLWRGGLFLVPNTNKAVVVSGYWWARRIPSKSTTLDMLERVTIIGLFGYFTYANTLQFAVKFDIRGLMMVMSEIMPVAFLVGRRPSPTLSDRPIDWALGLAGTRFPLFVTIKSAGNPLAPLLVCSLIILCGLFVQVAAKVVLGTSFGIIAANRGVKVAGPYRFVRHPMYVGYTIANIGIFLAVPSVRTAVFYLCALALQVARMRCEERVLRKDANYRAFAVRVRFRLIPGLF